MTLSGIRKFFCYVFALFKVYILIFWGGFSKEVKDPLSQLLFLPKPKIKPPQKNYMNLLKKKFP